MLGASGTGSGGALDLCFLNGCCSEELGRAARASGVATAVCWGTVALDPAARLFSTTFFETTARSSVPARCSNLGCTGMWLRVRIRFRSS